MKTQRLFAAALALTLALTACGGEDTTTPADRTSGGTPSAAPAPTGTVIEVKMVTDGAGNYFEPADLTVKPGDVVRFVLDSGVHNVSFPAAENAGARDLPEASPYLQLPGQTWDLVVDMAPGTYQYQCDPHALLGMVGTLTVQ